MLEVVRAVPLMVVLLLSCIIDMGPKGLAYDVMWTLEETYRPWLHTSSSGTKGGSRRQLLTRDMGVNMNKDVLMV